MSQSNFEFNVNVRWSPVGEHPAPDASQRDYLESIALDRISAMVSEGYREGELNSFAMSGDHRQAEYRGWWSVKEKASGAQAFDLPFGIYVQTTSDGAGQISSNLIEQFTVAGKTPDAAAEHSADAIEAFLLALACKGVDLSSAPIKGALEDAVNAIGGQLPEVDEEEPESLPDVVDQFVIYSASEASTMDGRGWWGGTLTGWTDETHAERIPGAVVNSGYALPQSLNQDRRWVNPAIFHATTEAGLCECLEMFCTYHGFQNCCAHELLAENLTRAQRIWLEQFSQQWEELVE